MSQEVLESQPKPAPSAADEVTPERLKSLFRPRSIALVGASDKSPFSRSAYNNLVSFGFGEKTYLVNKRGAETHGVPTYVSCADIPDEVDVAYFMVPQSATLDAMTEAAAAGIRNGVILSSGYGEAGPAGKAAQEELVAHARSLGMILLGPNHLGFANIVDQIPVASLSNLPRVAGPVALLSQSGASSAAMLDFAKMSNVDLSYAVTLGNEAMITAGHVIDFLVEDESTKAIALFLETVRDPEIFRRAARRAAAAGKAIVVLKAGSSELAARTAAAHTGALVGDDKSVDAVFRELGIIRVDSIEDMLVTADLCARVGRLARTGVGVVSISGGACDILADRAADLGVNLSEITPETAQALAEVMPGYGTVQNPLDVTGAAMIDPSIFTKTIRILSEDPGIGVVSVVMSMPWERENANSMMSTLFQAIGEGATEASTPVVFTNQVVQPTSAYTKELMAESGIEHMVAGLRQTVFALGKLGWWSEATRTVDAATPQPDATLQLPLQEERTGAWSEHQARQLLETAGVPAVPSRLLVTAEEAEAYAEEAGGPLALKIVSRDILHKSDIGGVQLGVRGGLEAKRAFHEIMAAADYVPGARIDGVLASPMRVGGTELLVGVVRDPQWGPLLAIAIGGVFVEVLGDAALASLPVTAERAQALVESLRGAALLRGVRGTVPADLEALGRVIEKIGNLAYALGDDLESLEINPLRVNGSEIEAMDALITWTN
jgi:acyl-CoA synthetase (NDP forming)